MSGYYFWGVTSSALFLSAIPAILHQVRVIWGRKVLAAQGALFEPVTQSISLNQVFSSYCAVYSFFLFGLVSSSPDPFLTYPRMIVGLLLYLVIFELFQDRRAGAARTVFRLCSFSLILPVILVATGVRASPIAQGASNIIVCIATLLMAQGNISQYLILRRAKKRGAVSLPMHLALYAKDLAGMMFGLQIGPSAWSIVVMHASNLVLRAPIILSYMRSSR